MKKLLLACITLSCSAISLSDILFFFRKKTVEQSVQSTPQPITPVKMKPKVAVFYIDDNIDFKLTVANLVIAAKDSSIRGILLVINNNGGHMGAYATMYDTLKKIKTLKPIIGLINGSAYSAGYMIACAADYIIAHSFSNIGSIGVRLDIQKYKNSKLKGNLEADVTFDILRAGQYKTITDPTTPELTSEEREYLIANLNTVYKKFIELVANDRKINAEEHATWADAKLFIADEAKELGLIDEIGTIFEAEQKLIELIKARNTDTTWDNEIEPIEYATTAS